jgi:hypothetical protein
MDPFEVSVGLQPMVGADTHLGYTLEALRSMLSNWKETTRQT